MSDCSLICRTCGGTYDLTAAEKHKPCPACGTENCRPQAETDVGDILRRATRQRLRRDFKHAEASYQFVLNTSPDEHEALWGLVQCRYAIEYVKDSCTGKPKPIVHAVRARPMLTDPDFREACDLAPAAVRAQYRQEAEYIDNAMAHIRELAATGDEYDVFLCHKTSPIDSEEGYTEDYNRAVQLYVMLLEMGYRVFFAPQAGLIPGDNYEAGIYHALSTARVMLVICSSQDHINSPWVRTEWQRFLEMSYEPGADKHLIPLLYGGFPSRRLPDDFRQLQAITMGELNAKDLLVAAVKKHVGERTPLPQPAPVPVQTAHVPAPQQAVSAPQTTPETVQPAHVPAPQQAVSAPQTAPEPMQPAYMPAPVSASTSAYAPESDFEIEGMEDGGVCIVRYTGPGGEVRIPPTLGGEPLLAIEDHAFEKQEGLTMVSIPQGVAYIGMSAFDECTGLKRVIIPGSVERIDSDAFAGCSGLTDVSIPEGVTELGMWAFRGCTSLISVTLPASMSKIEQNPFAGCTSLQRIAVSKDNRKYAVHHNVLMADQNKLICYPAGLTETTYTVPTGVTSLGVRAFDGCTGLTDIVIPAGVTNIGNTTFDGCKNLARLTIPTSVAHIAPSAFSACPDVTLRVHPNTCAHAFAQQNNIPFELIAPAMQPVRATSTPAPKPVGEGLAPSRPAARPEQPTPTYAPEQDFKTEAVDGGVAITGYTGPGGEVLIPPMIGGKYVLEIGNRAFEKQKTLTKVVIPAGVTRIGRSAFEDCLFLTSVRIPDSVTSIDALAFLGCLSLTSVSIPESVTSIGMYAFFGCPSLTLRVHPNTCAHAYAQQNNLPFELIAPAMQPVRATPAYAPESDFVTTAVAGGVSITGYTGPGGEVLIPPMIGGKYVLEIGDKAFEKQKTLTKVVIPAGVTSIGKWAFYGCSRLTSVSIPESVTRIGESAFSGCSSLTSVRIPKSVTSIGGIAFYGCSSLTSVSIPESVTSIGDWAFYGCSSLTSVSIPESVTSIGDWAFFRCPNLTLLIHPNTPAHAYAQKNNLRFELIAPA